MSKRQCWCFYHGGDLDGHCSGAVVRRWCDRNGYEFVPRPVDYGRPADWVEGEGADNLAVIVDFTPEGDGAAVELRWMRCCYGSGLIWIDHHETAIGRVGEGGDGIFGIRRVGTAACRLAWKYFFPGEPEPRAVELLGRYDVFDRSDTDEWWKVVLPFNFGLRLHATDPAHTEGVWRPLLDKVDVDRLHYDIIRSGEGHLLVLKRQNEALCGPPAEGAVALLRADRIAPSPYQTRAEGAAR